VRARGIEFEHAVDDCLDGRSAKLRERQQHVHAQLRQQTRGDVRATGQRLKVTLLVSALSPRPPLAEDLRVIVPGTQLFLFPNEIVAYAEPPAGGALLERNGRSRERIGHFVGNVFDVEHAAIVELLGVRGMPADPNQKLEIPYRCNEGVIVIRRKGAVDPIEETLERNGNVLTAFAQGES
jgi:hypothetical protein